MLTLSRHRSSSRAGCVFGSVLVLSLFAIGLATPACAGTVTYYYTGLPFTADTGTYTCPPECSISGNFTVSSPLAALLSYASISPAAFSFTDGNTIWNLSDSTVFGFVISTNSAAAITNWGIFLVYNSGVEPYVDTENTGPTFIPCVDCFYDATISANIGSPAGSAINFDSPGCWATSPGVACPSGASTPEPGSLALLGAGLACIGTFARRLARAGQA